MKRVANKARNYSFSTSRKTMYVTQFATGIGVFKPQVSRPLFVSSYCIDAGIRLSDDESIFELYNISSLIAMTSLYSIMLLSHLTLLARTACIKIAIIPYLYGPSLAFQSQ